MAELEAQHQQDREKWASIEERVVDAGQAALNEIESLKQQVADAEERVEAGQIAAQVRP